MRPTLEPGDRILIKPYRRVHGWPAVGSVVVARHPHQPELRMIKRLRGYEGDAMVLLGDNPTSSTDSRQLGLIPQDHLIGTVTVQFRTPRTRSSATRSLR